MRDVPGRPSRKEQEQFDTDPRSLLEMFVDWLQERRERRCRERGHKPRVDTRKGYRDADYRSLFVAYAVEQRRVVCRRCGKTLEPWEDTEEHGLSGLTLSGRDADTLRREGEVWM